MRDKLTANLAKLDRKESYFLDLTAEEEWPKDTLRAKLDTIRDDRKRIEHTLEQAENQLDDGAQFLTLALNLMTDPHGMYQAGSEAARTIMNRTIFTRLYVDGRTIVGHELNEPFNILAEAYSTWQGYPKDTDTGSGLHTLPRGATGPRSTLHTDVPAQHSSAAPETGHDTAHSTASPPLTLLARGSSKTHMVDLVGAYSKRRDLADRQARTLERLRKAQAQTDEGSVSVRSTGRSQRQWQVTDRLSEADRRLLVQAFEAGTPKWKLAERYGVSLSSVKRLIRKHRAVRTGGRS